MSKKLIVGTIILLVITGIVAAIHLGNQESIACMVIQVADQKIDVSFEDLKQSSFSGELTDGKGDTKSHNYTGILLKDLLLKKGINLDHISNVTVTSADNYSVIFTTEEVRDKNRLYVAVTVDGNNIEGIDPGMNGVQIIIFGDPNSRRCVRFAQTITITK